MKGVKAWDGTEEKAIDLGLIENKANEPTAFNTNTGHFEVVSKGDKICYMNNLHGDYEENRLPYFYCEELSCLVH